MALGHGIRRYLELMGMSSLNCLVCGRDMMSEWSYKGTPEWMQHVVVFMPDDVRIAGKYTGYSAVETGETIWSTYVDREGHERDDGCEGISIIRFSSERFFDKDNEDHGYLNMYMWEERFLHNACCYHDACWKAAGSPDGFRCASLVSHDQGFGGGNALFRSGGFEGLQDEDDEFWAPPDSEETAVMWWAVNSIAHFIYGMSSLARSMAAAEKKRELFRSIDRINEMVKEL